MIKRFIQKFLGRTPGAQITLKHGQTITAHRVSKREHRIDPHLLSKNAVKVTKTLQDAGYEAYIVGGAVRDLLLGIAPKDFDVATNATPEQVQKLFRRSRLIGRRFQIVHVTFYGGRGGHGSRDKTEIIEVSTFRAILEGEGTHVAESGRIPGITSGAHKQKTLPAEILRLMQCITIRNRKLSSTITVV